MSWAKIEGRVSMHHKVTAVGNEAFGAWVRMLAHSCEYLTDGVLRPHEVAMFCCGKQEVIDALLQHNMLESDGENYQIHDFHDYNPSAKEQLSAQKQRSIAGRIGGKQSASKRQASRLDFASDVLEAKSNPVSVSVSVSETPKSIYREGVLAVLDHYKKQHDLCRATPESKTGKKIAARLAEDFTVEQLCLASDGYHADPWHIEKNKLELEYIFRDSEKVRIGIEKAMKYKPKQQPSQQGLYDKVKPMSNPSPEEQEATLAMLPALRASLGVANG